MRPLPEVRQDGKRPPVRRLPPAATLCLAHVRAHCLPTLQDTSAENGASRLTFFRDLTRRNLTGVLVVTSGSRRGLVRRDPRRCPAPDGEEPRSSR